MAVNDPAARLQRLIDAVEPGLRRAVLRALLASREGATLEGLAELVQSGRFGDLVEEAARSGALASSEAFAVAYVRAGQDAVRFLSNALDVSVGFDQVNERAVAAMRGERLELIREFTGEQRLATRDALSAGIRRGDNPVQQARNFRNSIGLTKRQQAAVDRYRDLLENGSTEALRRKLRDRRFDATVRAAAKGGTPLTSEQIDRMVERYAERSLRFRSETIARTEALRAVNGGNHEAYLQAIGEGHVDPDRLSRRWVSASDSRVRHSHVRLNGLVRRIDETFPGDEGPLRFPGDPDAPGSETIRCRCTLSSRID